MSDTQQLPGHVATEEELVGLGFRPLVIRLGSPVLFSDGTGIDWDTVGVVPDSPGHYLFTVELGDQMHVAYVGVARSVERVPARCHGREDRDRADGLEFDVLE